MAASREDLRERLVAALEASPELTPEHRAYLADVFLDGLNEEYQLVPRARGGPWRSPSHNDAYDPAQLARQLWPIAAVVLAAIVLVPMLMVLGFATARGHVFGFMPILFLFLAWRFVWGGPHRGWYHRW